RALRSVERGREAVRYRVGNRDELDIERADAPAFAVTYGNQLGAVEEAGLFDAVPGKAEGERRAVDGKTEITQQERKATDVIFVSVRRDATIDATRVLAEVGEVGQHEIDAEHVDVGEHQSDVEQPAP